MSDVSEVTTTAESAPAPHTAEAMKATVTELDELYAKEEAKEAAREGKKAEEKSEAKEADAKASKEAKPEAKKEKAEAKADDDDTAEAKGDKSKDSESGEKDAKGEDSDDEPKKLNGYQRVKAKLEREKEARAQVEAEKAKTEAQLSDWQQEAQAWIAMREQYQEQIASLQQRLAEHGEAPDERDDRIAELEYRLRQREAEEAAEKQRRERERQLAKEAQKKAFQRQIKDQISDLSEDLGLDQKELAAQYTAALLAAPRNAPPPPVEDIAKRLAALKEYERNRERVTRRLESEPEAAPRTMRPGGTSARLPASSTAASMKATLAAAGLLDE